MIKQESTKFLWLRSKDKPKRKTKDVPIFLDQELYDKLEELINKTNWNYKSKYKDLLINRDHALIALIILSGVRIGEALKLKRLQFKIYKDHILLKNVETEKNGKLRSEIILPKTGNFARFTFIVESWLSNIPKEDGYVFPSGSRYGLNFYLPQTRSRAHWIIKSTTGRFPHWYRAVCENIYGKLVFDNNAYKAQRLYGFIINLASTDPFIQSDWTEDKEKIFKL